MRCVVSGLVGGVNWGGGGGASRRGQLGGVG